jgi:predicted dinucleotide-binding enzyme
MRIGVIGAGHLGATAAEIFVKAGHEVAIANSRWPESLAGLVAELGDGARAATVEDAAAFGEVVLVAIPFAQYQALPAAALAGKIVIDAMNDYQGADPAATSSELLAAHLPGARVVKAFNTMYWQLLRDRGHLGRPEDRLVLLVAGDDREAKARVARLIEEVGFAPVDTGGLGEGARRQQPGAPIYTELARRRRERSDPPGLTQAEAALALAAATRSDAGVGRPADALAAPAVGEAAQAPSPRATSRSISRSGSAAAAVALSFASRPTR